MINHRCAITWQSCLTPLPLEETLYSLFSINYTLLNGGTTERPISPMSDEEEDQEEDDVSAKLSSILNSDATKLPDVYIIDTQYNPELKGNKRFNGPKKDRNAIFLFTEKERAKVERGRVANTLEEFKTLVIFKVLQEISS